MQDYDFTLQHILGKTNTKADILSRKDHINTKEDNKDIQMLKKELWIKKTMAEVTMLKKDDYNGQTRNIERNQKKWHQRMGSDLSIGKR